MSKKDCVFDDLSFLFTYGCLKVGRVVSCYPFDLFSGEVGAFDVLMEDILYGCGMDVD